MYPLNEAFASSIIQKMWSQPYGKDALMKLRNAFKDLDINRISDSDIPAAFCCLPAAVSSSAQTVH